MSDLAICKAVWEWQLANGARGINVMHVVRLDAADMDDTDMATIGADMADWYNNSNFKSATNSALKTFISSSLTLEQIICSDVGPGPTIQATTAVDAPGTNSNGAVPNETAVVISLETLTPGRSGKGRTFLPGAVKTDIDTDGTLTSTAGTGLLAIYNGLLTGWDVEDIYQLAVFSPTLGQARSVSGVVVRDNFHHQRRRNS